ncbi:MAG TPA: acyl-CoA dehydratase activase [Spirochaetia bacterium]|nr:acyl-CoA dehydratase activase [Spirochaetia bacterium]
MDLNEAWVGLDVGSTTVKLVVVDPRSRKILHSSYRRHNADQTSTVRDILVAAHQQYPGFGFRVAVCGSAGRDIAARIGAFYVQEVVATSIAVTTGGFPARSVIELGGQDAKVIFLRPSSDGLRLVPHELRMNGSCAGGTGAFIDQIAELLHVPVESFESYAAKGVARYDISGRCGVFAKTDIQPLLHQGASIEDIALSSFHAIAKQTIGGLAQGLRFEPPVLFAGGPLTFNPSLVQAFKDRLSLSDGDIIIPAHPELFIALGAALANGSLFAGDENRYRGVDALQTAATEETHEYEDAPTARPFFASPAEREAFLSRHARRSPGANAPGGSASSDSAAGRPRCYLGIDAGSTTTKFVLLDEGRNLIYRFYAPNGGDALAVARQGLVRMRDELSQRGIYPQIAAAATTGYGEALFAKGFRADVHQVETVAHARAAAQYVPDVSFVLDIGGQDMKAIEISTGIITNIVLNEACSAGCGSFLETYARSLGVAVSEIADHAFRSAAPSRLGSRCTVFMNSSVITEQKNGKSRDDILAGLCRSIIENVFTKVIRMSNLDRLGDRILVQGGTLRNDAVLRAVEEFTGREVTRPPYPGEMGAIGAALLAQEWADAHPGAGSSFIGLTALESFTYERRPGVVCSGCANSCSRTIVVFPPTEAGPGAGSHEAGFHVTGNRCERGEVIGLSQTAGRPTGESIGDGGAGIAPEPIPDLLREYAAQLSADDGSSAPGLGYTIGIPRVLEFYRSLPYWRTLFASLGFTVVVSPRSTYRMFAAGLAGVASDTVCFPAKLVHGHVLELVRRKVDRIFLPMMIRVPKENRRAEGSETCPIVQGYPMVAAKSEETLARYGIPMDTPAFHFFNRRLERTQTVAYVEKLLVEIGRAGTSSHNVVLRAIRRAQAAQDAMSARMRERGRAVIDEVNARAAAGENAFAVVLAGRPYHADELVNHGLSRLFVRLGIPVLNLESLPGLENEDVTRSRLEAFNPFHTRMIAAAQLVAREPNLELVQIVSFGCGHDAILSDEVIRILRSGHATKEPLVLKLDEGDAAGPLSIRVRSFVETVRKRRETGAVGGSSKPGADQVKFRARDKRRRTVYAPVLSTAFSYLAVRSLEKVGFHAKDLPLADEEAFALGKRYVHNDICFPAQVNIGEMLRLLKSGTVAPEKSAMALAKNCVACRAGQYAALARKALDDAGFSQIPIVTTGKDVKGIHPGARISPVFHLDMLVGMTIADGMEEMRQITRPYETERGQTDRVFDRALSRCADGLRKSWRRAFDAFGQAVDAFNEIPVNREMLRPRVGIVGEILMNYHETANRRVQRYLEDHGMETVVPGLVEFFRKKDVAELSMVSRGLHLRPILTGLVMSTKERAFQLARDRVEKILAGFHHLRPRHSFDEVQRNVDGIIDKSYMIGEGWLMPAEIIQMAKEGARSFVILNPFGCMPNHITGRGMIKTLKGMFPDIQILALDYDPDISWGNIENRLQMLVMASQISGSEAIRRVSNG